MKHIIRTLLLPAFALTLFAAPASAMANSAEAPTLNPLVSVRAFMTPAVIEGSVNINTASQKQLELLPGIGPSTAAKIVAYRAKYPFKETLHLMRVKGVGRKTYAKIKPYLSVKGDSDLHAVKGKKR